MQTLNPLRQELPGLEVQRASGVHQEAPRTSPTAEQLHSNEPLSRVPSSNLYGKPEENHEKTMGKPWENGGLPSGDVKIAIENDQ